MINQSSNELLIALSFVDGLIVSNTSQHALKADPESVCPQFLSNLAAKQTLDSEADVTKWKNN